MKSVFFVCGALLASLPATAQEFPRFSFQAGLGYTTPVGAVGPYLQDGWNVGLGAGYNFSSHIGAMLNLGYDSLGINGATASLLGAPNGGVNVFHATLDPVVHVINKGPVDVYLTAGGGVFHLYENIGAYSVSCAFGGGGCAPGTNSSNSGANIPFLGYTSGVFAGSQVVSSYTVTKPGFDVGGGVAFGGFKHGKVFAEARWEHMFLTNAHIDLLPVTFGFRW